MKGSLKPPETLNIQALNKDRSLIGLRANHLTTTGSLTVCTVTLMEVRTETRASQVCHVIRAYLMSRLSRTLQVKATTSPRNKV